MSRTTLLIHSSSSTLFGCSPGGCRDRLIREFRPSVANDIHVARPPSCSPRCKSHTVISVRRTIHVSIVSAGILHHFRLLKSHFLQWDAGRSMAQMRRSSQKVALQVRFSTRSIDLLCLSTLKSPHRHNRGLPPLDCRLLAIGHPRIHWHEVMATSFPPLQTRRRL